MLSIFSCVCMSSLEKWQFRFFSHFLIGLLVFWCWVVWTACVFWKLIFVSCFICYHFRPLWGLSFHLTYSFLSCAKTFKFNQVPLVYFYFYFHYSRRWVIEDLVLIYIIECSMISSKSFIVSGLTCWSLIHFELIFVYGVRKYSNPASL